MRVKCIGKNMKKRNKTRRFSHHKAKPPLENLMLLAFYTTEVIECLICLGRIYSFRFLGYDVSSRCISPMVSLGFASIFWHNSVN